MAQQVTRQQFLWEPQYPAEIDWSNPITRQLVDVVHPTSKRLINRTRSEPLRTAATRGLATAKGRAVGFGATYGTAGDGADLLTTTAHTLAAPHSVFFVYLMAGIGNSGVGRVFERAGGAAEIMLCQGSNNFSYGRHFGGSQIANVTYDVNSTVGVPSTFCVTNDGVSATVGYLNAAVVSDAGTYAGTTTNPTGNDSLTIGNRTALDRTFNGWIGLFMTWDRVLNAEEVKSLNRNPWQIFAAAPNKLFAQSAAALAGNSVICPLM